jgi:hypothetical protein
VQTHGGCPLFQEESPDPVSLPPPTSIQEDNYLLLYFGEDERTLRFERTNPNCDPNSGQVYERAKHVINPASPPPNVIIIQVIVVLCERNCSIEATSVTTQGRPVPPILLLYQSHASQNNVLIFLFNKKCFVQKIGRVWRMKHQPGLKIQKPFLHNKPATYQKLLLKFLPLLDSRIVGS